jgi:hypothetical protein
MRGRTIIVLALLAVLLLAAFAEAKSHHKEHHHHKKTHLKHSNHAKEDAASPKKIHKLSLAKQQEGSPAAAEATNSTSNTTDTRCEHTAEIEVKMLVPVEELSDQVSQALVNVFRKVAGVELCTASVELVGTLNSTDADATQVHDVKGPAEDNEAQADAKDVKSAKKTEEETSSTKTKHSKAAKHHHKKHQHHSSHKKHSRKLLKESKMSKATEDLMNKLASTKWLGKQTKKDKKLDKDGHLADKILNWHIQFRAVGDDPHVADDLAKATGGDDSTQAGASADESPAASDSAKVSKSKKHHNKHNKHNKHNNAGANSDAATSVKTVVSKVGDEHNAHSIADVTTIEFQAEDGQKGIWVVVKFSVPTSSDVAGILRRLEQMKVKPEKLSDELREEGVEANGEVKVDSVTVRGDATEAWYKSTWFIVTMSLLGGAAVLGLFLGPLVLKKLKEGKQNSDEGYQSVDH